MKKMIAVHPTDTFNKDKERYMQGLAASYASDINAYAYAEQAAQGNFLPEHEAGFCILKPEYHEIIPIAFHIPHNLRKLLKREKFTFTTNQHFAEVVEQCAAPRAACTEDFHYWMREKTKRNLNILHKAGIAHSVEVYHDGKLVAGTVNLQIKSICISLSIFSRHSGAGNAAFLALQAILCRRNFKMHDAMMPSNLSRSFGGKLISKQDSFMMRRDAMRFGDDCVFPSFDKPLPVFDYCQPLIETRLLLDIPTPDRPASLRARAHKFLCD